MRAGSEPSPQIYHHHLKILVELSELDLAR